MKNQTATQLKHLELEEIPAKSMPSISEESEETDNQGKGEVDFDEIARTAYFCWQERGCPDGSPELDWWKAEELLGLGRIDGSARKGE